jgi:diadenosine tetraphosphatase ApaH/serine/threonine PP2A family protein phosphatase
LVYGILGDIHGNYDALAAVVRSLEELEVDAYVCVGDIVGYGAEPNRCIEEIRALGCEAVAGNHDYAVLGREKTDFFNPFARETILWTRGQLTPDNRVYLAELGLVSHAPDFSVAHATLDRPDEFFYLDNTVDATTAFDMMETRVLFVGHTHVPLNFVKESSLSPISHNHNSVLHVVDGNRAIVNVGSVGQPRDSDPRAAFATFDTTKGLLRLHRVDYDYQAACDKIYRAGLPRINADRLMMGR